MNPAVQETVANMRHTLIFAVAYIVLALAVAGGYMMVRRKQVAGTVPRAEVAASSACIALLLLTTAMWWFAGAVQPKTQLAQQSTALALRVLGWAGTVGQLVAFVGGFPFMLYSLGIGLWLSATTEAQRGEAGVPGLRRVAAIAWALSIVVLALCLWALLSYWGDYKIQSKVGH